LLTPGETDALRRERSGGRLFTIVPQLSPEHGVIGFEITSAEGHRELSRSRLFPLEDGGCILLHLAALWDGVDDASWMQHQRGTDADLENARRLIQAGFPSC
jgi:hypothetical protein